MWGPAAQLSPRRYKRLQPPTPHALHPTQVIGDNSANYTAWRWRCLSAGFGAKRAELSFLRACTLADPKNYQLWNHRRRVALDLGTPDFAEARCWIPNLGVEILHHLKGLPVSAACIKRLQSGCSLVGITYVANRLRQCVIT